MRQDLVPILFGGIDTDAGLWANRVNLAGGTVSPRTVRAVSMFTKGCKAAGIWDKLNRVNLFCGDQLAAALVPLKVGAGGATDTNVNFVAGDYTEATGITGNATTKYLRTGLIPSAALTLNNTHLAVYNRTVAGQTAVSIGSRETTVNYFEVIAPAADSTFIARLYNNTAGQGLSVSVALTGPWGLMTASRTSATALLSYQGSTVRQNIATTGGALVATELYVFASNSGGTAVALSSNVLAGYSVGSGLTAAEVAAYHTAVQQFQTALGRQV